MLIIIISSPSFSFPLLFFLFLPPLFSFFSKNANFIRAPPPWGKACPRVFLGGRGRAKKIECFGRMTNMTLNFEGKISRGQSFICRIHIFICRTHIIIILLITLFLGVYLIIPYFNFQFSISFFFFFFILIFIF